MIGIAAVFGAASIFAADIWLRSQASATAEPVLVAAAPLPEVQFGTIVVAAEPLSFGIGLAPEHLKEIPWPRQALPEGAYPTIEALAADGARKVLSPIAPNEPVLLAKLSGPDGRATLSNLLRPGMRAVTIRTDEIAGVGGFIMPGDRVDVVLTRNAGAIMEVAGNAEGAAGSSITSEIVVAGARVLSVGQGTDALDTTPQVVSSVTIEVTSEGAQKVALARNVGTLSLTLRAAVQARGETGGLTTISDFGGSVGSKLGGVIEAVTEPEGPTYKTVIVTRGTEAQTYKVVSPQQ